MLTWMIALDAYNERACPVDCIKIDTIKPSKDMILIAELLPMALKRNWLFLDFN